MNENKFSTTEIIEGVYKYIELLKIRKSSITVALYNHRLNHFRNWLDQNRISQINEFLYRMPQYVDLLVEKENAVSTINRALSIISSFLSWQYRRHVDLSRLKRKIQIRHLVERRKLTEDEKARIVLTIAETNSVDCIIVGLLFCANIPIRELINLKKANVVLGPTPSEGLVISPDRGSYRDYHISIHYLALIDSLKTHLYQKAADGYVFVNAKGEKLKGYDVLQA